VSLATIAAFTAAGLSLTGVILNVVLTARLTGQSRRQEWRREHVLPIIVDILFIEKRFTSKHQQLQRVAKLGIRNYSPSDSEKIQLSLREQLSNDLDEFDQKVIGLQLTASRSVASAAQQLSHYLHFQIYQGPVPDGTPGIEWPEGRWISPEDAQQLRDTLVEAMRYDMGLPS
jgi:hypothetical protein